MSLWSQFILILKKNFTLRRRQPVTIGIEFVWPILLLLIMAFIKRASPPQTKGPCYYQPLELPNGDFLSFTKSFVCMLDYKCYDSSRLKAIKPYPDTLGPLKDLVASGDTAYEQISNILETLKLALAGIYDIRNDPTVLKIQFGSISIDDFLKNRSQIEKTLMGYGLSSNITDAYLSSKIKIIEIYKVLNVSSKVRDRNLCDPMDAMSYFMGNEYFNTLANQTMDYLIYKINTTYYMNETVDMNDVYLLRMLRNMSTSMQADYALANRICSIPKRDIILDSEYLAKQINVTFIMNYTNTIIEFFSTTDFNKTITYLTNYQTAGLTLQQDFTVLAQFQDMNEIIKAIQSGLKVLDLLEKYNQQLLFLQKIMGDLSPIFNTIESFNAFDTLVDLLVTLNKMMAKLNKTFTVQSVFGTSLFNIFELNLASNVFISTPQLLRTNVNVGRSLQFLLNLKFDDPKKAICTSPKITGIFNLDFPSDIKSNLDYQLEKYCQYDTPANSELGEKIFSQLNIGFITQTMRYALNDGSLDEFVNLTNKLSSYSVSPIDINAVQGLVVTFNVVNAGIVFLEQTLKDTSKFDLKNVYTFIKKIIQIFVPDVTTSQVWYYIDMFLPFLLPSIPINQRVDSNTIVKPTEDFLSSTITPFLFDPNQTTTTPVYSTINISNLFTDFSSSSLSSSSSAASSSSSSSSTSWSSSSSSTFSTTTPLSSTTRPRVAFEEDEDTENSVFRRLVKRAIEDWYNQMNYTTSSPPTTETTTPPDTEFPTTSHWNFTTDSFNLTEYLMSNTTEPRRFNTASPFSGLGLMTMLSAMSPAASGKQGALGSLLAGFTGAPSLSSGLGNSLTSSLTSSLLGGLTGGTGTSSSSSFDILSLINVFTGFSNPGTSPVGVINTITSLLGLLPIGQIIPNSNGNAAIITSIPQILSLIQSFANTKLPDSSITDQSVLIMQWTEFIRRVRLQALSLIQILTNFGVIKTEESKIIQAVLSTNIETVSNPEITGKLILGCQTLNIWGAIEPKNKDVRNAISSLSLIMDNAILVTDTLLKLVYNEDAVFHCTNDPFLDYYNLTKTLNILEIAAKFKELFLNEQTPNSKAPYPYIDCMKISTIYDNSLLLQSAFMSDTDDIIVNKLSCFRNSIFSPYNSILTSMSKIFEELNTNTDALSLLGGEMSKLFDLVKIAMRLSSFFSGGDLLSNPAQISTLINILPTMLNDISSLGTSLAGLQNLQNVFSGVSTDSLQIDSIFTSLVALTPYQPDIAKADVAINGFLKKYYNILSSTSYSKTLVDLQKGVESLDTLVTFFDENFNGIQISKLFLDYGEIEKYLTTSYGFTKNDTKTIGESKINYNPQKLIKLFTESRDIVCNPIILEEYIKVNSSALVQIDDSNITNFWTDSSQFLCNLQSSQLQVIADSFSTSFVLPAPVREIFENDSIISSLAANSSLFTNLNISMGDSPVSGALTKLNDLFQVFAGMNADYSSFNLPNVLGKSLCGPEFNLRLEDYGYSMSPSVVVSKENNTGRQETSKSPPPLVPTSPYYYSYISSSQSFSSGSTGSKTSGTSGLYSNSTSTRSTTRVSTTRQQTKLTDPAKKGVLPTSPTLSSTPTSDNSFCYSLYVTLKNIGGSVIGNLVTPLVFGKILYTPKNNFTTAFVKELNTTFKQFYQLNTLLKSFAHGLDQFDDLKNLTSNLSLLLDNPFYADVIDLFILQDTNITIADVKFYLSTLENVTSLSNDWSYISGLLGSFRNLVNCFDTDRFLGLNNEPELEQTAAKLFSNGTFLVGLVFENVKPTDTKMPENLKVKIRTNIDNVPETTIIRPWLWTPGPADNLLLDLRYMRGFAQVQNLVERTIVKFVADEKYGPGKFSNSNYPVPYLMQFPYPKYKNEDTSAAYINYFILPIIITLMWSGNIGLAIRNLIKEKEKFIEETMKAMGLRPGVNWLAWFVSTFTVMIFVAFIVTFILKYGGIFPGSNIVLIFVSLVAFAFSAIMLSFFVGSFFTRTNLASLIGILTYFVSYLPFILVMSLKYEMSFGSKFGLCLFSATAYGYAALYMSWYEQQTEKGLQFEDIWNSPIPRDTMNFGWSIAIMILDGVIYGMLGWYIKNVFPNRSGARQKWYFLVTPKYWRNTPIGRLFTHKSVYSIDGSYSDDSLSKSKKEKIVVQDRYIEPEPTHIPVGISVKNLTKRFKEKTAVNNLSLKFFEGQITALLGHNGAGKSTTINVLTGIYAPTTGTAMIYDKDVKYEYDQIRKFVGICPQHDILFEYMTVKEHLVFYGKLKENLNDKDLKKDIKDMMNKMGLNQYAHSNVSALSGGLRRRLEVAIAFVAASKTVILDEPTSGVDPFNRMKIWDMILEFRAGRTILLTTHYLEEADILSDRIAIIHQGKLQCCGSSLFLKNRFGSGYILTVDRRLLSPSNASLAYSKQLIQESRAKNAEAVSNFISKRIEGVTLTRHINNTLTYTLPYSQKSHFEEFFYELEKNKNSLEIASYGISDTTLEEIFLLLTTRDDHGELNTPMLKSSESIESGKQGINTVSAGLDGDKDSGVAIELAGYEANSTKSSPKPVYQQQGLNKQQILSPNATLNTSMDSISQAQLTSYHGGGGGGNGAFNKYTKLRGRQLYTQQLIALFLKRWHHYRRNLRILSTNILLPCLFVAVSMMFSAIRPRLTYQPELQLSPKIYDPNNILYTYDSTNNSYLKMLARDHANAYRSVCSTKAQTNLYSVNQPFTSYICDLISPEKCSLIYETSYQESTSYKSIESSLKLTQASVNCTLEPYFIETHANTINTRYGGISYADNLINNNLYLDQSKVVIWFENQAYHSMTSFLHEFYSTYSQCIYLEYGDNCNLVDNPNAKPLYSIYNHPISLNDQRVSYDSILQKVTDIGVSLTILCAYSFIPAGFVVFLVRERITQEKRLQYVCGVKPILYWLSSFIWDFCNYLIIMSITLAVIASFGSNAYLANARNTGALILLLTMFGFSSLPMTYMMTRFFNDTSSAYMIVFCFTLFSGMATCVAVFLLGFIAEGNPSLYPTYYALQYLSLLFPSFGLGSGLIELTKNQILADTYAIFGITDVYKDPFRLDMLGLRYVSLFVTGVFFFCVIVLMELRINYLKCCDPSMETLTASNKPEDIDVSLERKRIMNDEANDDILVAKNLTKKYRKATGSRVCAVNNICFSIPWGHCFGLLGINGAGKTTTFKMITDEILPTYGSCKYNNMKMKEFLKDNIIGYCPQFDAVDEYLSGKEALSIYAKLIGITEIEQAISVAITRFKLQSFINVPIIKYSGGMKRVLSVAVSMLGDPQIVLLDEPTNAMDPEMRRRVWDNILKLIKEERSVLLTSHSMAECDALCSRLAIMVNGRFECMGTTQHLKHRFGGGYTLQIKVDKDSAIAAVIDFVESRFQNCVLKDKHGTKLEYIIPHKGNNLGRIFGVMEKNKDELYVADYSVSQTTLDQVFINFAKSGTKDSDDEDSDDMDDEIYDDEEIEDDNSSFDNELGVPVDEKKMPVIDENEIRVNLPPLDGNVSPIDADQYDRDTPTTFEAIKQHFNSLKKSRHIRKTSSAKSQDFKRSLRRSQRSRSASIKQRKSITEQTSFNGVAEGDDYTEVEQRMENGYRNLAFEETEAPIQEDLTMSITEDGEYYSRC